MDKEQSQSEDTSGYGIIHQSFPSMGTAQPAHLGSQSSATDKSDAGEDNRIDRGKGGRGESYIEKGARAITDFVTSATTVNKAY